MEQDNFLFLRDILTLSLMKVVPEGALQVMDLEPSSIAAKMDTSAAAQGKISYKCCFFKFFKSL